MSLRTFGQRAFAARAFNARTWGGVEEAANAAIVTTRLSLVGTSMKRMAIEGTSQNRLTIEGASR
jgi:hypothetical protein